jgi:hypothetical protein
MRVRVTLALDLDVMEPSEAGKVLAPLLAAVPPSVEQFSWQIKGQEWFEPRAVRNGKQRVARDRKPVRVRDTY